MARSRPTATIERIEFRLYRIIGTNSDHFAASAQPGE
jgi:hypothetical protein